MSPSDPTSPTGDADPYAAANADPTADNEKTFPQTEADETHDSAELFSTGTTAELVSYSLRALLNEQPKMAADAAHSALQRGSTAERETWGGWSTWLLALSQLYTNNPEPALINLQRAYEMALNARQPNLAMAVSLGMQLVSSHQHHQELKRQIEKQEVMLTQQFRAALSLALQALPAVTGEPALPSMTPEAQFQRIAGISQPQQDQRLPTMEIRCFGEFQVFRGGEEVNFRQNRKPADIFKYLLAHRERAVTTDTLLGRLWPEVLTDKGMHRLHLNISTLRSMLNPPNLSKKNAGYIMTGTNSYYLNPQATFEIDVDQFATRIHEAQQLEREGKIEQSIALLEGAVNIYRDDFLIENLFDDWTGTIRDFLRTTYVDMLGSLSKHYMLTRRYDDTLVAAKKMLDKDNYREDAHCFIMRALVGLNQRNQALVQYQQCVYILEHDLGVYPTPETNELYLRIKNNEPVLD